MVEAVGVEPTSGTAGRRRLRACSRVIQPLPGPETCLNNGVMANLGLVIFRPLHRRHVSDRDYPGRDTPVPKPLATFGSDDSSGFYAARAKCLLLLALGFVCRCFTRNRQPRHAASAKSTAPSKPFRPHGQRERWGTAECCLAQRLRDGVASILGLSRISRFAPAQAKCSPMSPMSRAGAPEQLSRCPWRWLRRPGAASPRGR